MPLVERAGVPFVVANASATSIAEKSGVGGNKWTFKVNPTDASMLDALIGWLDKDGKANNIAFLGEDTDFGRAGSSGLEAALKKRNQKLVMVDFLPEGHCRFHARAHQDQGEEARPACALCHRRRFPECATPVVQPRRRHSADRPRAGGPGAKGNHGERVSGRHHVGPTLGSVGRYARQQGVRRGIYEEV